MYNDRSCSLRVMNLKAHCNSPYEYQCNTDSAGSDFSRHSISGSVPGGDGNLPAYVRLSGAVPAAGNGFRRYIWSGIHTVFPDKPALVPYRILHLRILQAGTPRSSSIHVHKTGWLLDYSDYSDNSIFNASVISFIIMAASPFCSLIGGYDRLEDAAKARAEAEEKVFGDFLKWYEEERSEEKVKI